MTETAITRLTKALDPWAPGATEHTITLDRADAQAVLAIVADLCDDHTTCVLCGTTLCVECGVGEPAIDCSDRHVFETHCTDCVGECHTCASEIALDRKAEAYAEAHGLRY